MRSRTRTYGLLLASMELVQSSWRVLQHFYRYCFEYPPLRRQINRDGLSPVLLTSVPIYLSPESTL